MQIDRKPVKTAKKGDEIGIIVSQKVRKGYKVEKVKWIFFINNLLNLSILVYFDSCSHSLEAEDDALSNLSKFKSLR